MGRNHLVIRGRIGYGYYPQIDWITGQDMLILVKLLSENVKFSIITILLAFLLVCY
jgi:hypothetical protein